MDAKEQEITEIESRLKSPRFAGIQRNYTAEDVWRLRGSLVIEQTLARRGAEKLWRLLHTEPHLKALGALTGHQAVEMVLGGLKAVYASGWQAAGDANTARETYPDQSLYPANSVPQLVDRISRALKRADEIQHAKGQGSADWFVPIIADAEAGFGGHLNAFEIMKAMIEAGAAGVHFEDQLSSAKKCGHLGGKVIIPSSEFVTRLNAARFAADILGVPAVLIARTDALSGRYLANDIDPHDRKFITGERTPEGFFAIRGGIETAIARGLTYAPYADMLWCETSTPNIEEARQFAEAIHAEFPGKLLAYNCSPSFHWTKHLDDQEISSFQDMLGDMGYKFQFVTLAGFHALNFSAYELAQAYAQEGMRAYVRLQNAELAAGGYTAVRHQEFVGTGYFDSVMDAVTGGKSAMLTMQGSTEKDQF